MRNNPLFRFPLKKSEADPQGSQLAHSSPLGNGCDEKLTEPGVHWSILGKGGLSIDPILETMLLCLYPGLRDQ